MKKTNEASKQTGVTRRALQYYDDEGLLVVERNAENHRMYDQKALERIWEILVYKEMGFQLQEIKQLFLLQNNQKEMYFQQRTEMIEKEIIDLKVNLSFISFVQRYGMPMMPLEESKVTYKKRIQELKEKMKNEVLEEME